MIRPTDPASPDRSSSPKLAAAHPIDPHDAHHGGMTRRQWWWRKTALPLLTSLSLHAGVVIIGLLCFTAYRMVNRPPEPQPLPIPDGLTDPTPHDVLDGNSGPKIPLPPAPNIGVVGDPSFVHNPPGPIAPPSGSKENAFNDNPITPGFHSTSRRDPNNNDQPGGPDDTGTPRFTYGRGGTFDPVGNPGGGGTGDPKKTPTQPPPPTSTAYVCDASGSMMEKMPALKHELSFAVTHLRPWQKFSITFFQDEKPTYLNPGLLVATPENKYAAQEFLDDVTTIGKTDPIPGIKMAFAQHPQIMFLLTDGDFPNNDAVLAEIRSLEKQQHVVIHTIAFVGSSDTDTKFLTLLKHVAQETGGTFKKVDAEALESTGE